MLMLTIKLKLLIMLMLMLILKTGLRIIMPMLMLMLIVMRMLMHAPNLNRFSEEMAKVREVEDRMRQPLDDPAESAYRSDAGAQMEALCDAYLYDLPLKPT